MQNKTIVKMQSKKLNKDHTIQKSYKIERKKARKNKNIVKFSSF